MPRILLLLTALVATIAVAAGCGSAGSSASGGAALAPAGSLLYGEVTLDPDADQQAAIDSLIEKFPGEGSARQRIRKLMESAFSDSDTGLSFKQDVEPWLGDEAAFFVSRVGASGEDVTGALLVATDDEGKAQDAIEKAAKDDGRKASYKDHDYYTFSSDDSAAGVVDGWVVLGNGFKAAVDVAEGRVSLDDDDAYQRALDDAGDQRLGLVYFNSPAFVDQLRRSGAGATLGQFEELFKDPFVSTVHANGNGVRLESRVPESLTAGLPIVAEGSDLAGELPADSWLAIAQPELGKTVERYLDLFGAQMGVSDAISQQLMQATGLDLHDDVLSWMGDWALFVRGTSVGQLGGALIIETSDEAASGRAIDAVARLARRAADPDEQVGPLELPGGGRGVTLRTPDVPQPIHLFQRDGKVVLAYGDAAAKDALDPSQTLADSAAYGDAEDALGGDYKLSFYLAVDPIIELIDSTSAANDEGWQRAKPYLEPLGALVGGATKEGDKLRSAFGVSVK